MRFPEQDRLTRSTEVVSVPGAREELVEQGWREVGGEYLVDVVLLAPEHAGDDHLAGAAHVELAGAQEPQQVGVVGDLDSYRLRRATASWHAPFPCSCRGASSAARTADSPPAASARPGSAECTRLATWNLQPTKCSVH